MLRLKPKDPLPLYKKLFIFLPFHIRGKCIGLVAGYPYVTESYGLVLALRVSVRG